MQKISLKPKNFLKLVLILLPIIFLGIMLMRKSVNVPFYDQWELVPKIENLKQGKFLISDLWEQHNEHRLFFPRLVMLGLAAVTDWNTNYEVLTNFILAVVSFIVLLKILQKANGALSKLPYILPIALSVIWFSPVQSENWLWGWQIQWFLSVFGIMCSLYGLTSIINSEKQKLSDVLLLLVGGIVAQFSLGNGILIWPLLFVALLVAQSKKAILLAVAATASATTLLHYLTQISVPEAASKSLFLKHPIDFIQYTATYLGRPLSYLGKLTPILGVFVTTVFLYIFVYFWFKHRNRFITALPWFVLGFYAIGSALITSISRLGLGMNTAFTSRYTTISSLLLVSVVVLVATNLELLVKQSIPLHKTLVYGSCLLFMSLLLLNVRWGYSWASSQSAYLKDIRNCTHQDDPYEICLLSAYPDRVKAKTRIDYLKSVHWGGY